jgi:hypothetical protein
MFGFGLPFGLGGGASDDDSSGEYYGNGSMIAQGYRPKNPAEEAFVQQLGMQTSETINHGFELRAHFPGLRLTPLHWAVHLDIPELVAKIGAVRSVSLKAKVKGGLDVFDYCFSLNRVRCFAELIQLFPPVRSRKQFIAQFLARGMKDFLEALLATVNPECSNAELMELARSGTADCRQVIETFVANHPGDRRDKSPYDCRVKDSRLASQHAGSRYTDELDERTARSLSWMDQYTGGDWVWSMDPDRDY